MGPTWVLSAPDGPHVGPMNLVIRESIGKISFIFKQEQSNVTDLIKIQIPCDYFKMTIAEPLLTTGWPLFECSIVEIYSSDWFLGITMKILWIISSIIQTTGQCKRDLISVCYQWSYVSLVWTHQIVFLSMNISKSLIINCMSHQVDFLKPELSPSWCILELGYNLFQLNLSHAAKYRLIRYQ